jgi:hypothetical protein
MSYIRHFICGMTGEQVYIHSINGEEIALNTPTNV